MIRPNPRSIARLSNFFMNSSFFAKCPHHLVAKRLEQVGDGRPFSGLNEAFDGHAGDEFNLAQPRQFIRRYRDPNGIIGLAGPLVRAYIGGDSIDVTVNLRGGCSIERRKAQHRLLLQLDFLDILRVDLGFHRQAITVRDDQHDRFARPDHPSNGMDAELEYGPVLGRADIYTLQLVLGGNLALDEFTDLRVGLAQFLRHFTAEVLVDLDDFELDFGDLALGLRHSSDELRLFAIESGRLPLQLREAIDLNQVLFK